MYFLRSLFSLLLMTVQCKNKLRGLCHISNGHHQLYWIQRDVVVLRWKNNRLNLREENASRALVIASSLIYDWKCRVTCSNDECFLSNCTLEPYGLVFQWLNANRYKGVCQLLVNHNKFISNITCYSTKKQIRCSHVCPNLNQSIHNNNIINEYLQHWFIRDLA